MVKTDIGRDREREIERENEREREGERQGERERERERGGGGSEKIYDQEMERLCDRNGQRFTFRKLFRTFFTFLYRLVCCYF